MKSFESPFRSFFCLFAPNIANVAHSVSSIGSNSNLLTNHPDVEGCSGRMQSGNFASENTMKMKRVTFLAVLLFATACSSRQPLRTVEPLRVGTIVAEPSDDAVSAVYVGTVAARRSVALSFPLGGTLAAVHTDEGRRVRKGDLLAELDPASARQTYEAARAALEQAQDAYARMEQLHDAQSLPEIKWIEIRTRLRQAESACELARKNLDDCRLLAPFDGVVGKRPGEVGETVLPGAAVLTLLDAANPEVRFAVPEQEIARIGSGSRIRFSVAALGDRTFEAGAPEKGIEADPVAHTYDVRAAVCNPDGELLPGMVCRVTVTAAKAASEIVLPVSAVRQSGDGQRFVWKVVGDSVVRTPVTVGRFVASGVTVASGVADGDRIVTEGVQKIGAGSKVVWQ